MNVLVLGKGAREHALAWKISESSDVEKCFIIPGNAGMKGGPKLNPVLKRFDAIGLISFVKENKIELTVVGAEQDLVEGIVDRFKSGQLLIVGPTQVAAKLEGSKIYSKQFMKENAIATANFKVVTSIEQMQGLKSELNKWAGVVVKKDGLAAGKGVVVCQDFDDALAAAQAFFNAGEKELLIEEKLEGPEVSVFYLCQGESFQYLGAACDYKRLLDGDKGPNTGGMGCYSPASWLEQMELKEIEDRVLIPTLKSMHQQGKSFSGFLFLGLMMTCRGASLLEYNVRMGDPETQTIMPLIKSDIVPYLMASAKGQSLTDLPSIVHHSMHSVHVVKASKGYPSSPENGKVIKEKNIHDGHLFYAGVTEEDNRLVTSGGRVLGVTCVAKTLQEARSLTYEQLKNVEFEGEIYRQDIAQISEK